MDSHSRTQYDDGDLEALVRVHRALAIANAKLKALPLPHGPELTHLIALNEDVLGRNERCLARAGGRGGERPFARERQLPY